MDCEDNGLSVELIPLSKISCSTNGVKMTHSTNEGLKVFDDRHWGIGSVLNQYS